MNCQERLWIASEMSRNPSSLQSAASLHRGIGPPWKRSTRIQIGSAMSCRASPLASQRWKDPTSGGTARMVSPWQAQKSVEPPPTVAILLTGQPAPDRPSTQSTWASRGSLPWGAALSTVRASTVAVPVGRSVTGSVWERTTALTKPSP